MKVIWREAIGGLRRRRGRVALSAAGIALGAAMLATATVVGFGLQTGFQRSAHAADLPDVIARFDAEPLSKVLGRITALPDLAAYSFRLELTNVHLRGGGHSSSQGVVEVLDSGRRGYGLLEGREPSTHNVEAVVEQGVARSWGLHVGSSVDVNGLEGLRVSGISVSPDDVAYPLAVPRVYLTRAALEARFGPFGDPRVNAVELWLRNPGQLNTVLVQARASSYGIEGLRFVTREGVRVLIDQAAGIVIALLVALSVIALITATVMLAASARAEVQRRLAGIGVRRAIGASRAHIALAQAAEAAIVALPAGALGVGAGVLIAAGPSERLLETINELPPGGALAGPLLACWALTAGIPVLASAWPALRASRRPPIALMRGAELRARGGRSSARRAAARRAAARVAGGRGLLPSLSLLGARLVGARRVRLAATLAVLGVSVAFILLMLALASELSALESDPSTLGKRYQLTASLPAAAAAGVRRLPGVAAAAPRYEAQAIDSFSLGETIDVVAYRGDHTVFEAPPLVSGSRLRGARQAEVGNGLAQVLGLSVGSPLAIELPSGREARFQVAGIVNSLQHDGRIVYVSAAALLAAEPTAGEQIAVRLQPGASESAVSAGLKALGASATPASGAVGQGRGLIEALTAILRAVAIVDGLVCFYALVQALVLTARERRATIAVLRACGAGVRGVCLLLAGAAAAVVVPAAVLGALLERFVLGPAMARLAIGYASLELAAGPAEVTVVIAGLALLACAAVLWVARRATREPIVEALGG
ncbi:MAG TPA: FtsX-like permease family protein [Solirubrobacteraceae bacterium]|jgi:ABC-type antimicrobial peptide transport system permease subunit|nr:FtsX-like permease family protein [Solirubrobacteraceae bacterium]